MNSTLRLFSGFVLSGATFIFSGCINTPVPLARPGEPAGPVTGLIDVAPSQTLDATLLKAPDSLFRLGPGDVLEIEVMGDPSTKASVTVGPDGRIYYYLLSGMDVWGLTLSEAREHLGSELQKYVREKPVVSLSLKTVASQKVWLLGRVNLPGVYTLNGPTTLLDAIAQSGGMSSAAAFSSLAASLGLNSATSSVPEAADLSRSFLIRNGQIVRVDFQRLLRDGDLSQNVYLQADDFIFLPSATVPQVHVLGAVAHPQSQKLAGPLSVVQAIALSGGSTPEALLTNVAVLRGSFTHPQIAVLSVSDVLRGRARDMRLEEGDIVFVPTAPMTTLERYANLILDTFARTVGVNAGAHAAGASGITSIGISVTGGR
jgi:protein involved in polysaccharide export with SLBB domain